MPICHPERKTFARGLCWSCYAKLRDEERPFEQAQKAKGLKLCRRCGEWKPVSEFHRDRTRRSSECKPCRIAYVREYEKTRKDDPAFIEARRRATREWARRNRAYGRNAHLKRVHGITSEQYAELLEEQGGVCAICGGHQPNPRRTLAVDHDHTTGRVRGLLCDPCNHGLGSLGDDPERLRWAIEYLTQ